ncbi:MAG: transporter [Verrucomicrobiota bacterium]|nr:transporter [Verrucomicrobiota bacterium]
MLDLRALFCRLLSVVTSVLLPVGSAAAQSGSTDGKLLAESSENQAREKSGYHLFNPTPSDLLRELSTDRPDKTESPFTVDAGHFQWEMDFVVFTQTREEAVHSRIWNIAPVNLKVGLTNSADLQLIFDSYTHMRITDDRSRSAETTTGVGDLTPRLKINLWGNDGGPTAFAVMPFLGIPTNSLGLGNDAVSGGVIFPLAVALPGGWGMGLQTEVDVVPNGIDRGHHAEFVNSITFSHDLVGQFGGYVEFFSNVSTERGSVWIGTVDFGLTYSLAKNIQLDAGCNIGLVRSADDLQPFAGISLRF